MDKVIRGIFSMGAMTMGLFAFGFAIAYATFVESDYGTPASKITVFNAVWFEILLVYLAFGLIANIFKYKMYTKQKVALFSFHLSFIIIIIGSGITRHFSFEGQMPIGEGEATNIIYSSEPHILFRVDDRVNGLEHKEEKYLSEYFDNGFEVDFTLPNKEPLKVKYVNYLENRIETVESNDTISTAALEFVIQGETKYLVEGESMLIGTEIISFNDKDADPGIKITEVGGQLKVSSIKPFAQVDMMKLRKEDRANNFLDSSAVKSIVADSAILFESGRLYNFASESVMFKEYRSKTARVRKKSKVKDEGINYLVVDISQGKRTERVELPYKNGQEMTLIPFKYNDLYIQAGYGPMPIELPFYVRCNDFQLDKYPGSNMASSFASEVTVIDSTKGIYRDQRIFMNNVMDYDGYRFFQSNYYPNELGTVLSVNYDWWGTNVTYLGYLLMAIGMVLSLITYGGRFRELSRMVTKSREKRALLKVLVLGIFLSFGLSAESYAQNNQIEEIHYEGDGHDHSNGELHDHGHEGHNHAPGEGHDHEEVGLETKTAAVKSKKRFSLPDDFKFEYISQLHSDSLASLLIQDYSGRIIPFHTMADKLLRKVHRGNTYEGKNAVQVVMGMHLAAPYWVDKKIIYISSKIRETLGTEKYVSLNEISEDDGSFKWSDEYEVAHNKPDSKKSEYDKEIVKLGERYNIVSEILQFRHLRIIPIRNDVNNTWLWPFLGQDAADDKMAMDLAAEYLHKAWLSTDSKKEEANALNLLTQLKKYQRKFAQNEMPSKGKVNAEILYNKSDVFKKAQYSYLLIGLFLIVVFFFRVLSTPNPKKEKVFKYISIPFTLVLAFTFLAHGFGLGYRWYISEHAPWSNGYEAIVFIAWCAVLVGLIFARRHGAITAATAVLAALILFVSELNLLDPEISNLQPVLKSYWLMIHVAIITSSYAFLGLGAMLSFFNLTLYLFRGKNNGKRLTMNINEMTAVSEMIITIGLFMLTIGTFLGGVWANESWGRYWGWDPKETWALVSILTYAVILHLRYIPGLKDKFVFNLVTFWGYASIIFTFFGVNFKLTGLHSYAQGEGTSETPDWVILTVIYFLIFSIISAIFYIRYKRKKKTT